MTKGEGAKFFHCCPQDFSTSWDPTMGVHCTLCLCCAKIRLLWTRFPDCQADRSTYCVPVHWSTQILTQSKDSDNELRTPRQNLKTRDRRKQVATMRNRLRLPIPSTNSPSLPQSLLSNNDPVQHQQVTQKPWHCTPVVLHSTQPVYVEDPCNHENDGQTGLLCFRQGHASRGSGWVHLVPNYSQVLD